MRSAKSALLFCLLCFTIVLVPGAAHAACDRADPSCTDDGGIIGGFVDDAVQGLANALREGSEFIIKTTAAWWINIDSIDLSEGNVSNPSPDAGSPVQRLNQLVLPISFAVAIAGMIWGGIRLAVKKKSDAAWDLGTGVIRLATVSAIYVAAPTALLSGGDAFAEWVLDKAVNGDVVAKMGQIATLGGFTSAGAVIIAAIVMMIAGAIQAILMLLREGGVIVLSSLLVLSAAGGFNPATRSWFPRVSGWLLALCLYKPIAALCYGAAFVLIGDQDDDPRTVFAGLTMLLLSIVALPAMMKFFSWAAPAAINSGGGGAGMAVAAGTGVAIAALRGGGGGHNAATQSAAIERDLGPAGGGRRPVGSGPSQLSGAGSNIASSAASTAVTAAAPPVGVALQVAQAGAQVAKAGRDKTADGLTGGVA